MATDSDQGAGDRPSNRRLGRMTVFRGLAGEKAIEATASAIGELVGPDDSDARAPSSPTDSDVGAREERTTDSDKA